MANWFSQNNKPNNLLNKIEPNSELKLKRQLEHSYKWEKIFFRALIVGCLTFLGILIYYLHYN